MLSFPKEFSPLPFLLYSSFNLFISHYFLSSNVSSKFPSFFTNSLFFLIIVSLYQVFHLRFVLFPHFLLFLHSFCIDFFFLFLSMKIYLSLSTPFSVFTFFLDLHLFLYPFFLSLFSSHQSNPCFITAPLCIILTDAVYLKVLTRTFSVSHKPKSYERQEITRPIYTTSIYQRKDIKFIIITE